jgi:hypothetical protein
MTEVAESNRRFSVHMRETDMRHACIVEETSFEAAAVAYIEGFSLDLDCEHQISIIVRDLETGREHCFKVDLDKVAPCGQTS